LSKATAPLPHATQAMPPTAWCARRADRGGEPDGSAGSVLGASGDFMTEAAAG
jgi:hypothetical protein